MLKNNKCIHCGRSIGRSYNGFCQSCYHYFVVEGKECYNTYEGAIQYAPNGDAICPECGMAFRKLGGHIRYHHGMDAKSFYLKHNWKYRLAKASNKDYRVHMKDIQKDYCITNNLIDKGKATRFNEVNGNAMALNSRVVNKRCKNCLACQIDHNYFYCHAYNKECKYVIKCEINKE